MIRRLIEGYAFGWLSILRLNRKKIERLFGKLDKKHKKCY